MEDYMLITPAEKKRHKFRVKVLKLKQDNPSLSIRAIAALAGASYGKTYSVIKAASNLSIVEMLPPGNKRPYKLTPRIRKKIVQLYAENPMISMKCLGQHVSVSSNSVSQVLNEEGLRIAAEHRSWKPVPKRKDKIIQLKHEDPTRTLQSIADEVGCTRERVRQVLNKHGLNTQYPVDDMVAKRHQTFRNCIQCDKWLPASTTGRKDGICFECRTARRLAKKYSKFICDYCKKPLILSVSEYSRRLRGKRKYADKIQSTAPLTGVTCSYSCATRQRGFGTHVRGIRGKAKKNV
tara:strand:- start:3174 stop:4052 length:879 start_codon:yes stop_codon:yes gene_type:complete